MRTCSVVRRSHSSSCEIAGRAQAEVGVNVDDLPVLLSQSGDWLQEQYGDAAPGDGAPARPQRPPHRLSRPGSASDVSELELGDSAATARSPYAMPGEWLREQFSTAPDSASPRPRHRLARRGSDPDTPDGGGGDHSSIASASRASSGEWVHGAALQAQHQQQQRPQQPAARAGPAPLMLHPSLSRYAPPRAASESNLSTAGVPLPQASATGDWLQQQSAVGAQGTGGVRGILRCASLLSLATNRLQRYTSSEVGHSTGAAVALMPGDWLRDEFPAAGRPSISVLPAARRQPSGDLEAVLEAEQATEWGGPSTDRQGRDAAVGAAGTSGAGASWQLRRDSNHSGTSHHRPRRSVSEHNYVPPGERQGMPVSGDWPRDASLATGRPSMSAPLRRQPTNELEAVPEASQASEWADYAGSRAAAPPTSLADARRTAFARVRMKTSSLDGRGTTGVPHLWRGRASNSSDKLPAAGQPGAWHEDDELQYVNSDTGHALRKRAGRKTGSGKSSLDGSLLDADVNRMMEFVRPTRSNAQSQASRGSTPRRHSAEIASVSSCATLPRRESGVDDGSRRSMWQLPSRLQRSLTGLSRWSRPSVSQLMFWFGRAPAQRPARAAASTEDGSSQHSAARFAPRQTSHTRRTNSALSESTGALALASVDTDAPAPDDDKPAHRLLHPAVFKDMVLCALELPVALQAASALLGTAMQGEGAPPVTVQLAAFAAVAVVAAILTHLWALVVHTIYACRRRSTLWTARLVVAPTLVHAAQLLAGPPPAATTLQGVSMLAVHWHVAGLSTSRFIALFPYLAASWFVMHVAAQSGALGVAALAHYALSFHLRPLVTYCAARGGDWLVQRSRAWLLRAGPLGRARLACELLSVLLSVAVGLGVHAANVWSPDDAGPLALLHLAGLATLAAPAVNGSLAGRLVVYAMALVIYTACSPLQALVSCTPACCALRSLSYLFCCGAC